MTDIMRTYKLRLKPTVAQSDVFRQTCAAVRMVYNAANEQRRLYGRPKGTDAHGRDSRFNRFRQSKEISIPAMKHDPDLSWLTVAQSDSFGYALEDLDQAWDKYFDNLRTGTTCKRPAFRNASDDNSFKMRAVANAKGRTSKKGHFNGKRPNILFNNRGVKLPKIGWVSWVKHTRIRGDLRTATVTCEGGKWFICISTRLAVADRDALPDAVGVDLGVSIPVALSNYEDAKVTPPTEKTRSRIKRAQRAVSRSQRRSKRRKARVAELARLKRKEAVRVRCQLHKASRMIVNRFGTIAIEDLKVKNMTASGKHKNGLNRAMLEVPKYAFRMMLEYKASAVGGYVIAVNPAFTSQTCSLCGTVDKESRRSQDYYLCRTCWFPVNADHNAAKNILNRALGVVAHPHKTPSESDCRSATSKGHAAPSCAAHQNGFDPVEAGQIHHIPWTSDQIGCGGPLDVG